MPNDEDGLPGKPLSDREREVLGYAAEGLSNADIGQRLELTEDTVRSHIRRMLRKTGCHNRAHLVATAWIPPTPTPLAHLIRCPLCHREVGTLRISISTKVEFRGMGLGFVTATPEGSLGIEHTCDRPAVITTAMNPGGWTR